MTLLAALHGRVLHHVVRVSTHGMHGVLVVAMSVRGSGRPVAGVVLMLLHLLGRHHALRLEIRGRGLHRDAGLGYSLARDRCLKVLSLWS